MFMQLEQAVVATALHLVLIQLQVLAVVAAPTIRLVVILEDQEAEVVLITQVPAAALPDKATPEDQAVAALVDGAVEVVDLADLAAVMVHQEQEELAQLGQELAAHMPVVVAVVVARVKAYLKDGQADQVAVARLHLIPHQETELLGLITLVAAVAAYPAQAEVVPDTAEQVVLEL
jgi:hypothetical protein